MGVCEVVALEPVTFATHLTSPVQVLLVLSVVPLYLLWLRPLLKHMSASLLHSSALLLMFPEEIVRVMPRVSNAMTRIAKMRA